MNNPRPKAIRASNAVKVNTAGWGGNQEESGKRSGKTTLPIFDAALHTPRVFMANFFPPFQLPVFDASVFSKF
jgi:hypothetical protein